MPLTLRDVTYSYTRGGMDAAPAVRSISLAVAPGELVLIVGATGSGKSTLMRLAAGLLEPSSGSVALDGTELESAAGGGRIGLIFQDPESQLFADTVLDDVAFGPRNLGLDANTARLRAADALEAVGLPADAFGGRSPFALSGGEARRAAIAGVLAMRPEYLLADEPTAGLDAKGRRAVRDLLLQQREHSGVVVVSHAAEQFLAYADKMLVLDAGAAAWAGPASDAVADPSILSSCGIAVPDVLEVQYRLHQCGVPLQQFILEPQDAASSIVSALGRP